MKTGGTQVKPPQKKNSNSFSGGDIVECVASESNAYKKGHRYKVYINEEGFKCLRGGDGFEDIMSMMCSRFRKVTK